MHMVSNIPIVSTGIQQPPSIPDKLINTEQIPGADLSLNIVPNNIPKKIFVNNIGSFATIKRKTFPIDMKLVLDIKEIINPVAIQTIICIMPTNNPTRKYPSIKWYDFIGDEYNLFRKNVCLSFDTMIASVNITKENENTIIPGSKDFTSNIARLTFEREFIK